jgi:putative heme-binding domain-containing protein
MKVFEPTRPVLDLKGNATNGPALFKKHCVTCHRLDGEGVNVGSDLELLRTKPKDYLLLHTVVPEYEILPEFTGYVVDLKDDRIFTGLIVSETDETLTVRQSQGEEATFRRSEVANLMATTLSLMPQELEKNMSRQELADLLAWIRRE